MSVIDWKTYKLEDALDALIDYRGKTPKKTLSGIPLITAKIVKNGFIQEPNEFIAKGDYDSWMTRGLPELGDVVLTVEAPLGEVAQIKSTNIALAQRIITLRGKKDVLDNGFLKYFLQSDIGQKRLKERETGTTVTGIKQSELRLVKIDCPEIKEQIQIASILSSLDEKIELNRQTNQTLEAIAQTLFKETCIPKGEELPKGWQNKRLLDIAQLLSGGTPKTDIKEYWENGTIDWISIKDINPNYGTFVIKTEKKITELGLQKCSAKLLPNLTTVLTARGTVGNICLTPKPMTINQSCYGFKSKIPNTDYLLFYAVTNLITSIKQRTYGTVFDTITTQSLADLHIYIPPVSVLSNFHNSASSIFEKIKINLYEIEILANLRDSILPKLMKGKMNLK